MKYFKRIIFYIIFCFNQMHFFTCHINYDYNDNNTSIIVTTLPNDIYSNEQYNYTILYDLNKKSDKNFISEENSGDTGDLKAVKHTTIHTTETTTLKNNFNLFMQQQQQSQQVHKQQQQQQRDKYLEHIFNKYGNQDLITFEGLEHLMHNLGLGGLGEFKHTLEEHHPDGYQLPELPIFDELEVNEKNKQNNISLDENESKINDIFATKDQEVIEKHIDEATKLNKNENNIFEEQTIDDEINFKAMHDPKHRHPRHHDHGMITKSCLTPTSIVKLLLNEEKLMSRRLVNYKINENDINQRRRRSINDNHDHDEDHDDDHELEIDNDLVSSMKLTRNNFINLCPILLVQLEQNACNNDEMSQKLNLGNNYSKTKAWIFASIAILIISLCGLAGVTIVPLARTLAYQEILRFLVALAVGTLCGDALMHLMPHALTSHRYGGNKEQINDEAIWLCAFTFLSALFMYVIEVMLPLLRGDDKSAHGHSHHHHHHHHDHQQDYDKQQQQQQDHNIDSSNLDKIQINKDMTLMMDENLIDKKTTKLHPVAFMVVIGDGLHNLTDGLAIGAAFALDPVTGMATAFAVLCHELPHELGDFALLLKTGVTIKRAMFLNIVSSILSFIGMGCGLLIAGIHTSFVKWIYAATAGSFLYIALADLLPEMGRGSQKSLKSSLIQIIGISIGGLIMLIIAINEDSLRMLFE